MRMRWSSLLLALALVGCSSAIPYYNETLESSSSGVTIRPMTPLSAEALVKKWQASRYVTDAQYDSRGGKVEWRLLRVNLPADPLAADKIGHEIGEFAALASRPARITLVARNRAEDTRLSKAIKEGAVQSGGKNRVKFDHEIAGNKNSQISLEVLDKRL